MSIWRRLTRIPDLRTTNGGGTWTLVFQNTEPTAFYDCMAFWDKHRGIAMSDPIDGRFRILATNDGGRSWHIVDADMPPALPGEAGFAASGQCVATAGGRDVWFGTGGGAVARVFTQANADVRGVANTPYADSEVEDLRTRVPRSAPGAQRRRFSWRRRPRPMRSLY